MNSNDYEDAIASNMTNQFLLGRGKYFVRDRDWGGHDNTRTYLKILSFITKEPLGGYKRLEADICKLLDSEFLSVFDLQTVLGIFWSYFIDRKEEGKLHVDWHISDEVKTRIINQIDQHKKNDADLRAVYDTINRIKTRFGYNLLHLSK
ncbi:hypothetical protein [Spirosoma linguale]|uniref:Uncharacterized protein n=1 Tax=Spirosoma linguale (strain ATCC 33905 / DSM 74 / LMG 10896 / Claus 1) TaxID=504472 RepID=D2QKW0_SPILD|nr:hypothetical protein Slin_4294 [Spirosoma linguale DSM 74]